MSEELEKLERIKKALAEAIKNQKRLDKLHERSMNTDLRNSTQRQMQKVGADIAWANMDHDVLMHELHCCVVEARIAGSEDYRYGEKDYYPSCMHHYKKTFRKPKNVN